MKLCWFNDHRLGLVEGDEVRDVSAALSCLPAPSYPPTRRGDTLMAHLAEVRQAVQEVEAAAPRHPLSAVRLLSPVANPGKIIGVPVNYLKHVEEADAQREVFSARYQGGIEEQGFFLKAGSALIGCGEAVRIRFPGRRTDHEMELGVVIGKAGSDIAEEDAMDHVAGYAIALDMVVRGGEDRSLRKSVDSYAVLGPWLCTADEVPDPARLDFRLAVNGEPRQASNTAHMIMGIARQIAYASRFYTLYPGDIIMTGTCEGVGQVLPGDVMQCAIDGVGAMDVQVR